jgi:hypothetical protein
MESDKTSSVIRPYSPRQDNIEERMYESMGGGGLVGYLYFFFDGDCVHI